MTAPDRIEQVVRDVMYRVRGEVTVDVDLDRTFESMDFDELDVLELMLDVEDELDDPGVWFPDDALDRVKTPRALIDLARELSESSSG